MHFFLHKLINKKYTTTSKYINKKIISTTIIIMYFFCEKKKGEYNWIITFARCSGASTRRTMIDDIAICRQDVGS